MNKVKFILLIIIPLSSSILQAQDPSCKYSLVMKDIDTTKYDYKIYIEDEDYKPLSIDIVKQNLKKDWYSLSNHPSKLEYAILSANGGGKILVGYSRDYCYIISTKQLKIVVARRKKSNSKIKFMHASCDMRYEKTEIIIENFRSGQRSVEEFVYKSKNGKNIQSSSLKRFLEVFPRKIYLK